MFGSLLFGQYWTEDAVVATAVVPDPGGGEKKRKKQKPEENHQWPQPWQNPPKPQPKPVPVPIPVEALAPSPALPPATTVPPSPEAIEAIAGLFAPAPREVWITDPTIAARAEALRRQLQRELEDEEILMLMGFFD